MTFSRNWKLIAVVALVVLFTGAVVGPLVMPHSVRVRIHLERLDRLKDGRYITGSFHLNDYFHSDTWSWYLRGRSKPTQWRVIQMDNEEQALIKLGYFDQREFTLRDRVYDARFANEFGRAVSTNSLLEPQHWHIAQQAGSPAVIRVTGCKSDMATYERIISKLDTEKSE